MSESEALPYDHSQDLALEVSRPLPDWGGDDVFAVAPRARFAKDSNGENPALRVSPLVEEAPEESGWTPRSVVASAERKTVVITGRPGEYPRRHRPARESVDASIVARPDRVAAWAVGLGFGLTLAAILTAGF